MSQLLILAIKAVNGGIFVVLFALVGEVVRPKRLSGLFGAAPSVALGSLTVIALTDGTARAVVDLRGMMLGAAAMIVACVVGVRAVRHWHAVRGSGAIWLAWLIVATAGYVVVFA